MLSLDLTKDACKFWKSLDSKQYKQIGNKILSLLEDPTPSDLKALQSSDQNFFRVDVGEFRIIYRIEASTLKLALIGRRNDDTVYKQFKRKY